MYIVRTLKAIRRRQDKTIVIHAELYKTTQSTDTSVQTLVESL